MENVDASEHYTKDSNEPPQSLLNIIIDTNPHAWALLAETLPLSKAIANLLVFINSHLAFNHANQVAVIASHIQRAEFLYPLPPPATTTGSITGRYEELDTDMPDLPHPNNIAPTLTDDANFYRPFAQISTALRASLTRLLQTTKPTSLASSYSTSLAGALSLALCYTNKLSTSLSTTPSALETSTALPTASPSPLTARVLVLSVSPASPSQYIPLMNTVFASQRLSIPIDVLSLVPSSPSAFLQQACDATSGTYLPLTHPRGLLQTLLLGFLATPPSRALLIPPTQISVDFRAACFCHRKVVDVGFVCSICLSIFCEPPEGATCLTCGTHLKLGKYGAKPAVMPRKKKKRKKDVAEGTPQPE